jgi:hypothetical protein
MKYSRLFWCVTFVLAAATFPAQVAAGENTARAFYFVGGAPQQLPEPFAAKSGGDEVVVLQPHDGTFETGFTFAEDEEVQFVQRFVFPSENGKLLAFEACFISYAGNVSQFEFEFQYFAAGTEGEDVEPGAFREARSSGLFDVKEGVPTCHTIDFVGQQDAGDEGVDVRELSAYLGVEWDAKDFPTVLIAVDSNGASAGPGWGRVNDLVSPDWVPLQNDPVFGSFSNLGVRTAWQGFDPEGGEDLCQNDLQGGVVCLRDDRFEITGTWTDFSDVTQPLIWTPVEDINATGGFQNNPSGIQVVMRIADSCENTNKWWIWLGGFTDAGWDITVRDTATNAEQTYTRTPNGGVFPTTERDTTTFNCN